MLFLPQFYVGDNPDTLAGAQIIAVVLSIRAHQISQVEVPYQLAFSASATIDNPPCKVDEVCMLSAFFWGPIKDWSSMKANLL